jgi:hypothetical protein
MFITQPRGSNANTKDIKGTNAQWFSGLRAASRGSVREEEIHEVFGRDVGGRSGERVHTVHRHLVVDADRDDVARGNGLEVDLLMRIHHVEGFWTPR